MKLQSTRTAIGTFEIGVPALDAADTGFTIAPTGGRGLSATFGGDQLVVNGTPGNDTLSIGRSASGAITVNNGNVLIVGGTPTVVNTSAITVLGGAGNDTITLDESNGALPAARLFGGAGDDHLSSGSGADLLFGQDGNDTLSGRGGNDLLFGGAGNDVLVGGTGSDQLYGEAGNDRLVWNPGDGSDLFEGGSGTDLAEVDGGNGAEAFTLSTAGTRLRLDRVDPAPFALDMGGIEQVVVDLGGGDDTFGASGNVAAIAQLVVDGGAGNDTILGSNGADTLRGGDGNDFVDGNQGNDSVALGAGDDRFGWDPGDGSDTVDGGAGTDTVRFNGANIGESIALVSDNAGGARLTRDVAGIHMDLTGVERIELAALGGADKIALGDLGHTGVRQVGIALAAAGGASDAAADLVTANGSTLADTITASGGAAGVAVNGLAAQLTITGADAIDALVLGGGGGNDGLDASALAGDAMRLTLDGGSGHDRLAGSAGADLLLGGEGNDTVGGGAGNDVALLGSGDDRFAWNAGDGNDSVDGEDGFDRLQFAGASVGETVSLAANGSRVALTRDVAAVALDLAGIERIEIAVAAGSDTVVVGDLGGTGTSLVNLDLGGSRSGGDGAADSVLQSGSQAADAIHLATTASGSVRVSGLAASTEIAHAEAAFDRLVINAGGGDDSIDASQLAAGRIGLAIHGGIGNDTIVGSQGDDLITGGDGNDSVAMAGGDDLFVWNPGDDSDVVDGGTGDDRLVVNGANIGETIGIGAVGDSLRFTRDIAGVTIDAKAVEALRFDAFGGSDTISVDDLAATAVRQVQIDLGTAGGVGDATPDKVIVRGTEGDDVVQIIGDSSGIRVLGLGAEIFIEHFDPGLDQLWIQSLGGDDVILADGLAAATMRLVADGGGGDDVLIGSAGDDILLGGDGDDILLGGPGNDALDGGGGDNVLIQD